MDHGTFFDLILANPVISLVLASLSIYVLIQHVRKGKTHTLFSNWGLAGIALYFLFDGMSHLIPLIQGLENFGTFGISLGVGIFLVILFILIFKAYQKREEAHHHHVGSGDLTKTIAGYGLFHAGTHILIAMRGFLGFAVGEVHDHAGESFGWLIIFIENPWTQLLVAAMNIYILFVEFKHKHH